MKEMGFIEGWSGFRVDYRDRKEVEDYAKSESIRKASNLSDYQNVNDGICPVY